LKAIGEKLIPGIPEETRVAILQQTNDGAVSASEVQTSNISEPGESSSVLEEVIERATARSEVQKEINGVFPRSSTPQARAYSNVS
jgi:hypothetical protein